MIQDLLTWGKGKEIKAVLLKNLFMSQTDSRAGVARIDTCVEEILALQHTCELVYQQHGPPTGSYWWCPSRQRVLELKNAGTLSGRGIEFCPFCGGKIKAGEDDLLAEAICFWGGDEAAAKRWLKTRGEEA